MKIRKHCFHIIRKHIVPVLIGFIVIYCILTDILLHIIKAFFCQSGFLINQKVPDRYTPAGSELIASLPVILPFLVCIPSIINRYGSNHRLCNGFTKMRLQISLFKPQKDERCDCIAIQAVRFNTFCFRFYPAHIRGYVCKFIIIFQYAPNQGKLFFRHDLLFFDQPISPVVGSKPVPDVLACVSSV